MCCNACADTGPHAVAYASTNAFSYPCAYTITYARAYASTYTVANASAHAGTYTCAYTSPYTITHASADTCTYTGTNTGPNTGSDSRVPAGTIRDARHRVSDVWPREIQCRHQCRELYGLPVRSIWNNGWLIKCI